MIGMSLVESMGLPLADIDCKRFTVVKRVCGLFQLLRFPPPDKITKPGIRAGGVVRRVGEIENVFICSERKAFSRTEFRVLEFRAQFLREILATLLLVGEEKAQALDWARN